MRRHHGMLFVAMTALCAGAAWAGDDTPRTDADRPMTEEAKHPAADGDSSQPVADTWITAKVKSSLPAAEDVSGLDIEVDTRDGVVYLSGTVDNAAQIAKAKDVAEGIEGVGRVDVSALKTGGN